MVTVAGAEGALRKLLGSIRRLGLLSGLTVAGLVLFYGACTARVSPNEWGVEQVRFGLKTGIKEKAFGPGLYFVPLGTTMHDFPREIHVLEASFDRTESLGKAKTEDVREGVEKYFQRRDKVLGRSTHRVIDAFNVQTSDGYAVICDVTLLYSISDPVRIAKDFGWGSLYVDSFAVNTFRNGVLQTIGKMNAETFYNEELRIAAVKDAETFLRARFAERGFKVETLLLRNYVYAENYEKSLQEKKVAVQTAEKNRKEALVNEEHAKLEQIQSKGNAAITIAESEVNAQIAKIRAEAELYASQTRAKADKEVNVAQAEAKRLKADALNTSGGRYVVALETAKMFENIEGAVMTPEQYISFIRSAWAVIGVSSGTAPGPSPAGTGVKQ
jgi:regulator of protease activity HflC (stomatin/prohibitin superfamily)